MIEKAGKPTELDAGMGLEDVRRRDHACDRLRSTRTAARSHEASSTRGGKGLPSSSYDIIPISLFDTTLCCLERSASSTYEGRRSDDRNDPRDSERNLFP